MSDSIVRKICLQNYDAYGFDLDYTIAKFNLVNQIQLSLDGIVDFLVNERGYHQDLKLNLDDHKDFICKGLIVDKEHGNIIKLSHNGKVLRASHGFRMLSQEELVSYYGKNRHWKHYNKEEDVFKLGKEIYAFKETYFATPELVIVARIVELLDQKNGGPLDDYRNTTMFTDILDAFDLNYIHTSFEENKGVFFPGMKTDPKKYYLPCSEGLKAWLRALKYDKKCVFMITSSHIDFANLTATNVLGSDWRSYFDIIITNARKPGFFDQERPFLSLDGCKEDKPVDMENLQHGGIYSSGNHKHLQKFISKYTGKSKPKVIYFGDSMRSDAITTKTMTDWDVGLVLEEMEAEGYQSVSSTNQKPVSMKKEFVRNVNTELDGKDKDYLLSKAWGSFFYQPDEDPDQNRHMNTFWGELITRYSDIAIPSIEYIAGLPLDIELPAFNHDEDGNTDGFIPDRPLSLQRSDT